MVFGLLKVFRGGRTRSDQTLFTALTRVSPVRLFLFFLPLVGIRAQKYSFLQLSSFWLPFSGVALRSSSFAGRGRFVRTRLPGSRARTLVRKFMPFPPFQVDAVGYLSLV